VTPEDEQLWDEALELAEQYGLPEDDETAPFRGPFLHSQISSRR